MRIRRRQVPLPLSSLSPAPVSLSDLHLTYRSAAGEQLNQTSILHSPTVDASVAALPSPSPSLSPKPSSLSCPQQNLSSLLLDRIIVGCSTISKVDRQPSDHHQTQQTFRKPTNAPDSLRPIWPHNQEGIQNSSLVLLPLEDDKQQEKDKSNYSRENGITSSDHTVCSEVLSLSNPLHGVRGVDGRWCEEDKVFPLKKRKGSFEIGKLKEEPSMESTKIKTSRMKTKMNNKCSLQHDGDDEQESLSVNRSKVRGTTLLEGSRCSRVNGRGWRCCQQTLVGYSLCEHHLGKGRLRSMAGVRSRSSFLGCSSTTASKRKKTTGSSSSSPEKKQTPFATTGYDGNEVEDANADDYHHESEKKPLLKRKKTVKLGRVKARSISSLLCQTNNQRSMEAA